MTDKQRFINWVKSKGYNYEVSESSDYCGDFSIFVQVFIDTYIYEEWEFSTKGEFIDKFVYDLNAENFHYRPKFYLDFTF